jgi:general secretion pathway protein L
MSALIIILSEAAAPSLWGRFDRTTGRLLGTGKQDAGQKFVFAEGDAPDDVRAVVPGASVLTRSVAVPPQTDIHLRKAAAFMLEDDLAVDSAEMHFALDGEAGAHERTVAAVSHAAMKSWRERLDAFGLKAGLLVPDYLALNGQTVVADHGHAVSVRTGATGFTIETAALDWLLEVTFKDRGAIRLLSNAPAALMAGPLKPYRDIVQSEPLSDTKLLEEAYAALKSGAALNLLQGAYAPRRNWAGIGREWRRAAMLAGAALLLGLSLMIVDSMRLGRHAALAEARAEAVFRQAVPDVKRVVNPRAQIRAHLQTLKARASRGFLQSSDILFAVVAEIDGAEIQTLRFDAKRGETTVTLSIPSYDAIERVKTGVASRGGMVQEGGARQDGARIVADIAVRLP